LFAIVGTAYGSGDGSTTFNLPNPAGRSVVQREASASLLPNPYFSGNSTILGQLGGNTAVQLLTANLPPYTPAGSVTGVSVSSSGQYTNFAGNVNVAAGGNPIPITGGNSTLFHPAQERLPAGAQGGSSSPVATIQPTIIANRIMRII